MINAVDAEKSKGKKRKVMKFATIQMESIYELIHRRVTSLMHD